MPTGILRFFIFFLHINQGLFVSTHLYCHAKNASQSLKIWGFAHVFLGLSSKFATKVKSRMLKATWFSPFWVYHSLHKYLLVGLQESDNLQHCKNPALSKINTKMLRSSGGLMLLKSRCTSCAPKNFPKTMLNQHYIERKYPQLPTHQL
jgi:hypothetical protein